jgi:peptide-methionine (R)-S-oxide reductase
MLIKLKVLCLTVLFLFTFYTITAQSKKYALQKKYANWHKNLGDVGYAIARKKGTEKPFSSKYWDHYEKGTYYCKCCLKPLFNSKAKFESGTGWPSFWQPINNKNIEELSDKSLGLEQIEVVCSRCGVHLGHVFSDGPKPTGLRYCINGVALIFNKTE